MMDINPKYIAFLQGGDYIVNAKIDDLPDHPDEPGQYFIKMWIKFKEQEWEIDYNEETVTSLTDNDPESIEDTLWYGKTPPWRMVKIHTPEITFRALFESRGFFLDCNEAFYENNPDKENYLGAVISKENLRYLKDLKEII